MKTLITLGLVVCCSGLVYSLTDFLLSERIARSLVESRISEDVLNSEIIKLADNQCTGDLAEMVSNRILAGSDKGAVILTQAKTATYKALFHGILWLVVLLFFIVMLKKSKKSTVPG